MTYTYIEGIGDEVVYILSVVIPCIAAVAFMSRYDNTNTAIHPLSRDSVESVRLSVDRVNAAEPNEACPICLGKFNFPVTTNCGHKFCAQCFNLTWEYTSTEIGMAAPPCPLCRTKVTVLMKCFFLSDDEPVTDVVESVNRYNRRFGNEPRPIADYIRDVPFLLRHLFSHMFSVGGLVIMFRMRILLCVVVGVGYLVSPLDVLPEAVFGVLGLIDDLLIILLIMVYVSILYRRAVIGS